jgi:methionyl-tRNA formyltransferase
MKLVFFGTASFAVPALRVLAPHVCLVVSQPGRPSGRGLQIHDSPVGGAAKELGLRLETPEKSRAPEFVELVKSEEADAMIVAAYGQILSQALLDATKRGGFNLHGSILPKYRGAAPIQRCILNGDTETGVSLMQMDRGMDTGDVIDVATLNIGPDETAGELQSRLAALAAGQISGWIERLAEGRYPRKPQDNERATMAPKVEKIEAELSFERPGQAEYNRFRAFTPAPGAFLKTEAGIVKLSRARLETMSGEPGMVLATAPELVIGFARGSLALLEVQPEGKKRMSGVDYANGARLKPGSRLL